MALLDVSDVLDDPDFWSPFVVTRRVVTPSPDGTADALPDPIQTTGVVIPDGGKDLVQTGDGEAIQGDLTIFSRYPLSNGDALTGPDTVTWDGADYRVIQAKPWLYGAGFTQAICKLATLNPSPIGAPDDAGGLKF